MKNPYLTTIGYMFVSLLSEKVTQSCLESGRGPGLEAIKPFSCSTQESTKFQLLIKTIIPTNEAVAVRLSDVVFYHAKNVKMPTFVGILIYEQDKFCAQLSWVWKKCYNLGVRTTPGSPCDSPLALNSNILKPEIKTVP